MVYSKPISGLLYVPLRPITLRLVHIVPDKRPLCIFSLLVRYRTAAVQRVDVWQPSDQQLPSLVLCVLLCRTNVTFISKIRTRANKE